MENQKELSKRFKEVLLNGKWIANTNYKDLLLSISWVQATKKTGTLNTISAITQHINYYISGILNVFKGGNLEIKDKYSFDFPPIKTKKSWENVLQELFVNSKKLAKYIEQMSAEQLEQTFVKEKYGSYRRNIEALIEHSYYHLGQISLIKKIINK